MTRQEAIRIFEKVRKRTQAVDVIDICDAMIGLLSVAVAKEQRGFDRAAYQKGYMRDYMRRWREKKKHALRGPALTEVGDGGRRKGEG